jgi:hypothetical protein
MSVLNVQPLVRARRSTAVRFGLDVAEWCVLLHALLDAVPSAALSPDFTPEALGLDPRRPLSEAARRRAWSSLCDRGLARYVPNSDDLDAVIPPLAAGLFTLAEAGVRLDVRSWSGSTCLTRSLAWCDGHTVALARRRRRLALVRDTAGTGDGAGTIEMSFATDGALVGELLEALPHAAAERTPPCHPTVTFAWESAGAVAAALDASRDVVPYLLRLPAEPLADLGAVAVGETGGAQVVAHLRAADGEPGAGPAFQGAWLWTGRDVVELAGATCEDVTLRRATVREVRTRVLSAVTDLLHADEVL